MNEYVALKLQLIHVKKTFVRYSPLNITKKNSELFLKPYNFFLRIRIATFGVVLHTNFKFSNSKFKKQKDSDRNNT